MPLLALRCPRCHSDLAGLGRDRVFFCPSCRLGWEASAKGLAPRKVGWAVALKPQEAQGVFLPFWRVSVDYELVGEFGPTMKALAALPKLETVWVAAFGQRDVMYYGDLGLLMTLARVDCEISESGPGLWGASRPFTDTVRYVKLFILKAMDKVVDIGRVEVEPAIHEPVLAAVPFYPADNKLVSGILGGAGIPVSCLEDGEAILRAYKEMGAKQG